jgi:diguanylate cyclase (GGDEF)-like protein/PAS domain S-box-containing protein
LGSKLQSLKFLGACLAIVLMLFAPATAQDNPVFDVNTLGTMNDLSAFRGIVTAVRPSVGVPIETATGAEAMLELDAKGQGPDFVWAVYSFKNSGAEERNIVVSVPFSRFPGSGFLVLRPLGSSVTHMTTSNSSARAQPVASFSVDAISLALPPGEMVTLAIEGPPNMTPATAWEQSAFELRSSQLSFARGAVLGIALLAVLACLALVSLRPHRVTAVGAAFAAASLLFLAHESGIIALLFASAPAWLTQATVRAVIETLLLISAIISLYAFSGIARVQAAAGVVILAAAGLGVANLVLAVVEPDRATTVARLGFALTAVAGFPVMLSARSSGTQETEGNFLFWLALMAWTFLAVVLALITFEDPRLSVILAAGLCCVLVALAYVLVRFAFGEGYLAKAHLTDQVRRSLALAGARHHLWDWSPTEGEIDYSEDFASVLGYRAEMLEDGGQDLFTELLHPEDRPEFLASAGAVALGQARHIEQDVRLRGSDGYYYWFALKARALPGRGTADLRCIGTLTDISKAKELEKRLLSDSIHDPVTGLPSRAIFLDRLEQSASSRTSQPVHVLLVDLDRFKSLNDGLGHDGGDQLLRAAGQRIAELAGEDATVARMAGSQFAIMYPISSAETSALTLAEAICQRLGEAIETGLKPAHLSACIGISSRSAYGVEAEDLMAQAAAALHAAHDKGPGTIMEYDSGMRDDRAADVALESDLRRAIGRAEIEVHYQPIMQLATLDIIGFEALARWRHPQLGLVAPENFIDAAERTGLIGEIGQFVLNEAARQLGQWQRTLFRNRHVFVSVNASATQLLEQDFLVQIQRILSRDLLAPASLKIEVTESVVMRYPERVERLFGHLRALGIGLACDDFGTGFSSLSSLRHLPFDTLKLDRSFLDEGDFDERTARIIGSIATMAHGLEMQVVAEGIEDQRQIDQLAALGCDYGQGFLLGSPASAKDIDAMLAPTHLSTASQLQARTSFASTALTNQPPPPGAAPMARRVVPEPTEPVQLPSIFDVSIAPKSAVKRRKRKRTPKRKAKASVDPGISKLQ